MEQTITEKPTSNRCSLNHEIAKRFDEWLQDESIKRGAVEVRFSDIHQTFQQYCGEDLPVSAAILGRLLAPRFLSRPYKCEHGSGTSYFLCKHVAKN